MSHTLGSVAIPVFDSVPFQYSGLISRTRLIGDGTSDAHNEVLQSGALPNRTGVFSFRLFDIADVDTLQGYFADQDEITFEDRHGMSRTVVIEALEIHEVAHHWEGVATLIETDDPV